MTQKRVASPASSGFIVTKQRKRGIMIMYMRVYKILQKVRYPETALITIEVLTLIVVLIGSIIRGGLYASLTTVSMTNNIIKTSRCSNADSTLIKSMKNTN